VVQVGAIKTTVDRSDLYAPEEGRGASASRRVLSEPLPSRSVMPAPPEEVTTKLDLRGVQSDDAIEMLDAMLDRAVRGGWPLLLVVHGHGTGVIKRAVRDHLIRSPYVKKFRSGGQGEGGDGVTVVEL
jgi:DNA mismatch repair protein MutS2